MAQINVTSNTLFQSGYTYLQAVGSDGSDGTAQGRQLKWDFLKLLGDSHLPKGDYTDNAPYTTSIGFNKSSDYVHIYKTKFSGEHYVELNTGVAPSSKTLVNGKWVWEYILPVNGVASRNTTVYLTFTNTSVYTNLAATENPNGNEPSFIGKYTAPLEVNMLNQLFFSCAFTAAKKVSNESFYIRAEAIGLPDSGNVQNKQLNARKKYTDPTLTMQFLSENTDRVRFDHKNIQNLKIRLIGYNDYIVGRNGSGRDGNWEEVETGFALTLDDTVMQRRFMETYVDGEDGHWPRFNNSDPISGQFTVNKDNYYDRWRRSGYSFNSTNETNNDTNGLQHFIHTYMKYSTTDLKATVSFQSDDEEDVATQTMSCLDMLRMVSLDYHVGRIMGMGHVDIDREYDSAPFIYCLEYVTTAALETPLNSAGTREHLFMSLPTSYSDYRLPKAPVLDECTFGATIENGTETPTELTDINGYAAQENMRFININRKPYQHEKPIGPFFSDATEFILADETQPIAYGVEYKEVSESGYRIPELSHDDDYLDVSGVPETIPIVENGGPRLFTHQEEEEGTHVYAAYAINWFSRVSALSNTKQVTTDFPEICRMLPPFNFATQLIQDEDPSEEVIEDKVLILTTVAEQQALAAIPESDDHTLVRTTFDWNHVHNHAHPTVDYAEFFFREDEPTVIKGKIASVTQINGDLAEITTTSYDVNSVFPAQTVQPAITSQETPRFIGALLSTGQSHYMIESVQSTGSNPTFRVRVLKQTQPMAPVNSNQNQFIAMESVELPQVGDLFFVVENMSEPSAWDVRHNSRVYLEKFYTNSSIALRYSPTLAVSYPIDNLSYLGANTVITLGEPLKSTTTTGVMVEYRVRRQLHSFSNGMIHIQGDWSADLTSGKKVRIFAHESNDNEYTIAANATYDAPSNLTSFAVTIAIPDTTSFHGILAFEVSRSLLALNATLNTITIGGHRAEEIQKANVEFITESDGSQTRFVVGGISTTCWLQPLLDDQNNGTGFIQIVADWGPMEPHPDPRINWYKGTVRLPDVSGKMQVYPISYFGNLLNPALEQLSFVIQDPGFIPADPNAPSSADFYTLDLNEELACNIHPSYRFYLDYSNGFHPVTGAALSGGSVHFDEEHTLPDNNPASGNKQTLMSVRSFDVYKNLHSYLSTPTVLLAQQIIPPVSPALPQGPLFASRPDVYGKSTYTFDTVVDTSNNRQPYALVFFRAASDKILDTLYTKETQLAIKAAWDLLPQNFRYDPGLWNVLLEGTMDPESSDMFLPYETFLGSFRWPLPDNPDYYVPYQSSLPISTSNPAGGYYKPFADTNSFELDQTTISVYGKQRSAVSILKEAIQQAFIPMTENPPVFAHLKTGKQTSGAKSVVRDANGQLLDPLTNDIYPMARIYENNGETVVRFTDYTLDGASTSLYFYCAAELDNKLKASDPSPIMGPVRMVDSFAPDQPQVRKSIIQLRDDYAELPTAVQFDLNPFIASERISKLAIYRCTNETDALSVRTMQLVTTIPFGSTVKDEFTDVPFPLFGEQLYYRLVAIREVMEPTDMLNTQTVRLVEIPSKPSDVVKVTLADNYNPEAPELTFIFGNNTTTAYENVQITWSATCYNGTYSLQKMNSSGNWNEVHKIGQKTGVMSYPPLNGSGNPDFTNFDKTVLLPKQDDNDTAIYHRYRVVVENSSGLFNLQQKEYICQEVIVTGEDFDTLGLEDNSGSLNY